MNNLKKLPVSFRIVLIVVLISFIISILLQNTFRNNTAVAIDQLETFENSVSRDDYFTHGDATYIQTNSANEAHGGKRALKIESNLSDPKSTTNNDLSRWMTVNDKYPVKAGEQLNTEVYLKAINVKEKGLLSISFFKDKGSGTWADAWVMTASSSSSVTGSSDWKKIMLTVDVPAQAVYARYEFRLYDKGTLLIDDFKIIDTGKDLNIKEANKNIKVYETPGNTGPKWGAQVVFKNTHYMWVNATCKQHLIDDGNVVSTKPIVELNSQYKQLKTGRFNCSEVRSYNGTAIEDSTTGSEGGSSSGNNGGTGAGVIVTPQPGGMSNSEAILYTGPNQFDTSVIPTDAVVRTSLHGINQGRGQQLFTVDCLTSHNRNDDPIVFPGKSGVSHNHEFFGDTQLNALSTIESIISNPVNTCEVGGDRSAYWTPTAYQDGKEVKADNNKFYYKVGLVDPKIIVPMPTGLRMIAGNAKSTGPQSPQVTYFFTTTSKGKHTEPHTQSTHGGKMFTIKPGENGVRFQLQYPQCWDGIHLWLPNSTHMAYPTKGVCPSTHPKAFLQLMFNLGYSDATGGEGFKLSSGEWFTAHGDFINGWKPETMERLVQTCVREKRYCGLTSSDSKPCTERGTKSGCIEFRAGEKNPRFYGKIFE
jgi:hypothetical protein